MRTVLACSIVLAVAGTAAADVPADSIKLTLRTPKDSAAPSSTMAGDFGEPTTDVLPRFFNLARCQCDQGGATQNVLFNAEWTSGPPADSAGTQLFAWVGSSCASAANLEDRLTRCSSLTGIPDAVAVNDGENLFVGTSALLIPGTNSLECSEALKSVTYGLYTSVDAEATISAVVETAIDVDMDPPPLPTMLRVAPQEGQISLSWDALSSEAGDVKYFQALCAKQDGSLAHAAPTHTAQYDTVLELCGGTERTPIATATIENLDELTGDPVTTAPAGLDVLGQAFVCGQATGGTAGGISLEHLENNVGYVVVLVSMDKAGNVSATLVPRVLTPRPVTDFWEDLNEENPEIEGGLCLLESTYGGGGGGLYGPLRAWRDELRHTAAGRWIVDRYYAWGAPLAAAARESVVARIVLAVVMLPLVALALLWHALGLPLLLALVAGLFLWRRRRHAGVKGRRLRAALVAAVVLVPSLAAAQGAPTPYWDDDLAAADDAATGPRYHVGIRIGPFLPDIDDDRFPDPGPYERMFGKGSWMPALDIHRVFGTRFGQLGGGLSVGYFSKTAEAYVEGGNDMRSAGNDNTLKIIPFELTAIWRASQLHDNWNVPLVPYLRGGLAYSLWWVRRPDGDLAKACPPNLTNCDRAIGGSLGLVGAAGLAIRAEGIDPSAARSMRDSGLDHAGFYAEVEMGWIDGFGSATKLSLGDLTWFAGIDFEF